MELAYVRYQHEDKHKYVLILLLGEHDEKYVGLDTKEVTEQEAKMLRRGNIDQLNLRGKLSWIKSSIPSAYSKALRSIRKDRSQIVRRYPVPQDETKPIDQAAQQ
jgi:hypothetical protein